jgi:hypothetical protein
MVTERRAELRAMVKARVESIEREAVTKIHVWCLEAWEQTVTAGLTLAAAQQFIEALPRSRR